MKGGYAGRVLSVDLSNRKIEEEDLPEEKVLRAWIGCWGLALRQLYDMVPPGVSARDPENPMIFWNGPLTAADVPGGNNISLATKNFNTDLTAGRSHTHGAFGSNMKRAGYDAVVITGRSEKPVYLSISDKGAKLCDAQYLWRKDSHETEMILKQELGKSVSVAAIGPAGENLCAGALIANDENHNLGHSGVGAVMGSKNLKAIVTQGTKDFPIAHADRLPDIKKRWTQLIMGGHRYGRSRHAMHFKNDFIHLKDRQGLAAKNFTVNQFYDFAFGLSTHRITAKPCHGCPHVCPADVEITSGPHKGYIASISGGGEGCEGAGAVLGIADPAHWLYLLDQYDRFGVEASVFGCTLAMAIEAFEKGLLTTKETDGLELKWGDPEMVEKMLHKYAYKEGFGAILAMGPLRAAEMIGGNATDFAVHIKGSGMNLHDWRNGWGMLLCHVISGGSGWPGTAADAIGPEPDAGYPTFTLPFNYREKPEEARRTGILKYMKDTNGTCGFMTWNIGGANEIVRDGVNAVTGWDLTVEELLEVGERLMQMERAFNVRQGLKPDDDYHVSPRLLEAPKDGRAAGKSVAPYIRGMIDEYYRLMGWDLRTGRPWKKTLERFGLDDTARDLWG
jgi:aldehyde:ferredoxin oxidoreductase